MLDRERERLFAILGPGIAGARVLDLFSGTGAIGLEALSRGAALCTAMENGHRVLPVLRRNIAQFDTGDRHRLIPLSAFRLDNLPPSDPYDIVVAAPPFPLLRDEDWRERFHALFHTIMTEVLIPSGVFVLEMPARLDPAEVTGLGPAQDRRQTAASVIAFWTRPGSDPVPR